MSRAGRSIGCFARGAGREESPCRTAGLAFDLLRQKVAGAPIREGRSPSHRCPAGRAPKRLATLTLLGVTALGAGCERAAPPPPVPVSLPISPAAVPQVDRRSPPSESQTPVHEVFDARTGRRIWPGSILQKGKYQAIRDRVLALIPEERKIPSIQHECLSCHAGILDSRFDAVTTFPPFGDPVPETRFTNRLVQEYFEQEFPDPKERQKHAMALRAHPRLDLYLDPRSPHPLARYDCMTCHRSEDRSRDPEFTEYQRKNWELNYMKPHPGRPEWTLVPLRQMQGTCVRCHAFGEEIPGAETYNAGLRRWERGTCYACHATPGMYTMEEDLPLRPDGTKDWSQKARRPGPPLVHVASKVDKKFAYNWILNPPSFKPTARMPPYFPRGFFGLPQLLIRKDHEEDHLDPPVPMVIIERTMAACLAEYVFSVAKPQEYPEVPPEILAPDPKDRPSAQVLEGRTLLVTLRCIACHQFEEVYDRDFHLNGYSWMTQEFATNLSGSGDKFDNPIGRRWLYQWLKDPTHYDPDSPMPNFRLTDKEIGNLMAFLLSLRVDNTQREMRGHRLWTPTDPPLRIEGDHVVFQDEVAEKTFEYLIEAYHWDQAKRRRLGEDRLKLSRKEQVLRYGETLFEFFGCYACHVAEDASRGAADWTKLKQPYSAAGIGLIPERNTMMRMPLLEANFLEVGWMPPFNRAMYEQDRTKNFPKVPAKNMEAHIARRYGCTSCHRMEETRFLLETPACRSGEGAGLRRYAWVTAIAGRREDKTPVLKEIEKVRFTPEDVTLTREFDGVPFEVFGSFEESVEHLRKTGKLAPVVQAIRKRGDLAEWAGQLKPEETEQKIAEAVCKGFVEWKGKKIFIDAFFEEADLARVRIESWLVHPADLQPDPASKAYPEYLPERLVRVREPPVGGAWGERGVRMPLGLRQEEGRNLMRTLPPPLRSLGRKAKPDWLAQFLRQPETIRPRLAQSGVRMPTPNLDEPRIKMLVEYFQRRDRPSRPSPPAQPYPEITGERYAAFANVDRLVRQNCLQCHSLDGERQGGQGQVLALELSHVYRRVQREWLEAFLRSPRSVVPFTGPYEMPTPPEEMLAPGTFEVLVEYLLNYNNLRVAKVKWGDGDTAGKALAGTPPFEDRDALLRMAIDRLRSMDLDRLWKDGKLGFEFDALRKREDLAEWFAALQPENREAAMVEALRRGYVDWKGSRIEVETKLGESEFARLAFHVIRLVDSENLTERLDDLLFILDFPSVPRRAELLGVLGRKGKPEHGARIAVLLDSPNQVVRANAIDALVRLRAVQFADRILALARKAEPGEMRAILLKLRQMGARNQAAAIAEFLKHESDLVRRTALEALMDLAGPEEADAVVGALKDREYDHRQMALRILQRVGGARFRKAVEELLLDRYDEVKGRAAVVLADWKCFDEETRKWILENLGDVDRKAQWLWACYLARAGERTGSDKLRELAAGRPLFSWLSAELVKEGINELNGRSGEAFEKLAKAEFEGGEMAARDWAAKISERAGQPLAINGTPPAQLNQAVRFSGGSGRELMLRITRETDLSFVVSEDSLLLLPIEEALKRLTQ